MIHSIRMLAFCGLHVLCLGVFAAAAYGLGRRLLGNLTFRSLPEEAAFAVALGLGSFATLFFAAGLFHAFNRESVIAAPAGSIWIGRRPLRDAASRLRLVWARTPQPAGAIVLAGFAFLALALFGGGALSARGIRRSDVPPAGREGFRLHALAPRDAAATLSGLSPFGGAPLRLRDRNLGAEYLLVNARDVPTALPHDESFREHFVPVFDRPGITAFELREGLFRAVVPVHL